MQIKVCQKRTDIIFLKLQYKTLIAKKESCYCYAVLIHIFKLKISYFSVSSPPYLKKTRTIHPLFRSLHPPNLSHHLSIHQLLTKPVTMVTYETTLLLLLIDDFLSANQQCPLKQLRINLTALDVRFTLNSLISLASLLAPHCVASKSVVSFFFSKFWSSQCASTREHFFSFLGGNKFRYQLNNVYFWNRKKKFLEK